MVARWVLAFLAVLAAGPALAQGGQCDWLQSQYLAGLRQGVDPGRRLAQAQAAASRMNCGGGGFFFFFSIGQSPGCGAVMADIRRIEGELNRQQTGGWAPPDLSSLREELRQNGCELPQLPLTYGRARTICVRTCDGYYFPINFSSKRSRWKVDAEACQSMYGAAGQAELYTYDSDGDVADARSLTGKRYGDQPFAFQYRNSYAPACASQLPAGIAALGARYLARKLDPNLAGPSAVSAAIPVPPVRPTDAEDPETVSNRAGDFVPGGVTPPPTRVVRQVGPSYYAEVYSVAKPAEPKPSWWQLVLGGARAAESPPSVPASPVAVSQTDTIAPP
jgi:hypothetical protein